MNPKKNIDELIQELSQRKEEKKKKTNEKSSFLPTATIGLTFVKRMN